MEHRAGGTVDDPTEVIGRRILAGMLDLVVLLGLIIAVGLLAGQPEETDGGWRFEVSGGPFLIFVALALLYYYVLESSTGQTLGKKALGIRVVRTDGSEPGSGSVAGRTLMRLIDVLPVFYLLGVIVLLISRRQRLGDMAAGTTVIRGR